ncbi:hypothetical protein KUV95_11060 [Microbulbifer agarilyticus]|uniref:hypothetical protein n=1 Tax=Microbulbifer agarilyticus TaxID=260552 RepID=UPI001C95BE90|nr:hypothetical protein [Microbulbifer agarilyticus]MBY6212096.1 hypothetical protein [Microbulbifer agarilyticus]
MNKEKTVIRKSMVFLSYLVAVVVAFLLSSIIHTQVVLSGLTELGVQIGWQDRLVATGRDIAGLLPGYGMVIAIGLAIGFLVMGLLRRFTGLPAAVVYPIGGVIAYLAFFAAMHPIFHVSLIASTRDTWGLLGQCLAGLVAGFVFAYGCRRAVKAGQPS